VTKTGYRFLQKKHATTFLIIYNLTTMNMNFINFRAKALSLRSVINPGLKPGVDTYYK